MKRSLLGILLVLAMVLSLMGINVVSADVSGATDLNPQNVTLICIDDDYDENDNGYLDIGELLDVIDDYISGTITISQLLQAIRKYIDHTPVIEWS